MTTKNLHDDIQTIAENLAAVEELLLTAYPIQWRQSPAPPVARDDTSERSIGTPPSDPTAAVVLDERRLRVRAEVRRAEAVVRYTRGASQLIREGLQNAIEAWGGVDPEMEPPA